MQHLLWVSVSEEEAMSWRMREMCDQCPFAEGAHLAKTLGEERMAEIKDDVIIGQSFKCHKTYFHNPIDEETGEWADTGKELECAGALAFRQTPEAIAGVPAAFQRLLNKIHKEAD